MVADSVQPLCAHSQSNLKLDKTGAFLATPGYPKPLTSLQEIHSCSSNLSAPHDDDVIEVRVADMSSSLTSQHQCALKLQFEEELSGGGVTSSRMTVCVGRETYRDDLLYSSSSSRVYVTLSTSDDVSAEDLQKGILLQVSG